MEAQGERTSRGHLSRAAPALWCGRGLGSTVSDEAYGVDICLVSAHFHVKGRCDVT